MTASSEGAGHRMSVTADGVDRGEHCSQVSPGGLWRGANDGVILVAVMFVASNLMRGGVDMLVSALWPR